MFEEFYRKIVFSDTELGDVNYKEISRVLFNEVDRLNDVINKAAEYNEHLIKDAKYHLNLGHLRKMKKILKGDK